MSKDHLSFSDEKVIESFQKIQNQFNYLKNFCRENSIPLFAGCITQKSENYNIFKLSTIDDFVEPFSESRNQTDNWDYLVSRLKHFKPSFILVEEIKKHPILEETFGYYVWRNTLKYTPDNYTLKSIIDLHDRIKLRHIGIKIYIFFSDNNICITHDLGDALIDLFQRHEKTQEDFAREAKEEDAAYLEEEEAEDLEYQKEQEERNEKIELLARELSKERKLILTKNADQREAVTRDFFGKRMSEIKSWDIETIARRAIDIFDFEELPSLVSALKNQGKTAKQISDELGIGLAKIKKIFAIAPTESTPHANRDFLQSIIDEKDSSLSEVQSTAILQMIRHRAIIENDVETLDLLRKAINKSLEQSKSESSKYSSQSD